jgi:hypothetical protein
VTRKEIMRGLNSGRVLRVDRRDCPELPWLLEQAEAGVLESEFVQVDDQYSYVAFRKPQPPAGSGEGKA